jgi:SAM-dependent methyltransferase
MSQTKWDEKAANYTRFDSKPTAFQAEVFDFMAAQGCAVAGERLLDIGCGTGVYTLHLAQKATHVDALDFSEEMLKIMQEDAKTHGIHNINAIHSRFDTFTCNAHYALAFCSMSPAVSTPEMCAKMHACATQKVFLGWAGKRHSSLHDPIFKAFGKTYTAPRGGLDLKAWLETQHIPFAHHTLKETRTNTLDVEESTDNVIWHLEINKVPYEKEKVTALVKQAANAQGVVENVITSEMVLLVF